SLERGPATGSAGDEPEPVSAEPAGLQPLRWRIPLLTWPATAAGWAGLGLALCLFPALLYLLIRFVARRGVWLDLKMSLWSHARVTSLDDVRENTLVLGPPHSGKSQLIRRPEFRVVDLLAVETTQSWNETLAEARTWEKGVVAIDHFQVL